MHTMDVLTNHRELHIESKRVSASCMRFYGIDPSMNKGALGRVDGHDIPHSHLRTAFDHTR